MAARLPDEVKALLDAPNFWHLATLNPDGSPHSTVVWVGRRGEHVVINSPVGRVKPRNIANDPRVSLSVSDPEHPYSNVSIQGTVVETVEGDEAVADIDRLAAKYLRVEKYPLKPGEGRVTFVIEPKSVLYRPPAT